MPSYKTNDPKGWMGNPKRGAEMGRPSIHLVQKEGTEDVPYTDRLYLRRVRLDSGGYDSNGTYFGVGNPLYWVANEDGTIDYMLRASITRSASVREDAKMQVRIHYPSARFYR